MQTKTTTLDELLAQSRFRRSLPDPAVRRLLRERAGLSQDEVASVLGVSRPAVTRWETGKRTPRGLMLTQYVELLDRLAAAR
jgi:DNA-binding transcriptional regulator YiaG